MLDTCRHLRPGCLPSPATSPSQLVLEACRQGAELDVVLAPVEREVVVDAGDHEYEDYDEETDTWVRKFHWGDIRVRLRARLLYMLGRAALCACLAA